MRGAGIFRKIIVALILVFSASAQFTAITEFLPLGVRPNLLLIGAVVAGFCLGGELGGFVGFCLGLYQDAMCGKILGMYALFYLYSGVLAGIVSKWRAGRAGVTRGRGGINGGGVSFMSQLPVALICVYMLSTVNELLLYVFAYVIPVLRTGTGIPGVGFIKAAVSVIMPSALINTILSLPYLIIIGRLAWNRAVPRLVDGELVL